MLQVKVEYYISPLYMVFFYSSPHKRISTSCCPNMIQVYIPYAVLVSTATVFSTETDTSEYVIVFLKKSTDS